MSCNWSVKKLGDLVKFTSGGTPSKSNEAYWGGDIPWISASSMDSTRYSESELKVTTEGAKNGTRLVPKDTVLLLVRGGALHNKIPVGITTREVTFNQDVKALVPKTDEITPWYLLFWLISIKKTLLAKVENTGIGAGKLDTKILQELEVPLPPKPELQRLEKFCKALDDKIILNADTNQTLEQLAQAIFKSWFVDFDPVKAKMNGEQPEGMDAATASLFPEKLVESELGLIPEGWSASCMGEHFNITMGQSPKGETYNEEGKGIAFFQGRRDFGFRYPDVRVYTTDPKRFAKAGDTLISVRAPVGDKNMAAIDCCIGRGVAAIKHKSDSRSFTYAFMSHIEKKLGDSGSSGTVFSSINQKELKKVSFVAPPQELIEAFHKIVDPIDQKVEVLSKESESLSSLRDTLLPKLLSGEIELGQAQELAEVE
ncbi:TPA: restriction endonuclease subunit S [Vibrio parahaemolyticus]|nr:restriction endonuclease subunit S [Vibrio parahaemolyticus]HCG7644206.1 restriction endonuclease subunit S [Vibrio parahaemolyticus]HCM1005834.1 restriction endonuclease subunit S [Vibrio parahaemolyticus]